MNEINTPYINDPVLKQNLWASMSGDLKFTLMNDFLSKYSLQKDLYALKGLVAALLHIDVDSVTDIQILNPIEPGELLSDKDCILDIKLELNGREIVNIEIQSRFQDFWPERSITYLCRNFDHLKDGETYDDIRPCIQVGILDNGLFKKDDERYTGDFCSEYKLLHTTKHTEYSSKFTIIVISLSQLEMASEEDRSNSNGLYFWAKLFKATTWEELKMIAEQNPMMESFVGTVKNLTAEAKVAQACERRRRFLLDQATLDKRAKEAKKKVEELTVELEGLNQKMTSLDVKLEALDAEISEKNAEISEKNAEISEKNAEISEKNAEISEKDATISEKDAQIGEQREEINRKDQQIKDLMSQIEELKKK